MRHGYSSIAPQNTRKEKGECSTGLSISQVSGTSIQSVSGESKDCLMLPDQSEGLWLSLTFLSVTGRSSTTPHAISPANTLSGSLMVTIRSFPTFSPSISWLRDPSDHICTAILQPTSKPTVGFIRGSIGKKIERTGLSL